MHPSKAARGGSAIVIKLLSTRIKHYEDVSISTEQVQVTSLMISCKTLTMKIAVVCCPPKHCRL